MCRIIVYIFIVVLRDPPKPEDGDIIVIDAVNKTIDMKISDAELAERKAQWSAPALKHTKGILYKYAKTVSSASEGCVTDKF